MGETRNARNSELEAPLLLDPYDQNAWVVYGDWLQQQGDPRGDYIALKAAGRWNEMMRLELEHGAYFRGPLTSGVLGWGFVDEITTSMYPAEALEAAEARFVTRAHITGRFEDVGPRLPVTIRDVLVAGPESVAPLAATFERLHRLEVISTDVDELPCGFSQLRSLDFGYHAYSDPVPRRLLARELPSLTQLALSLWGIDADLVRTIANAPYASRLTSMYLFFLDDAAATVLREHIGRFTALTKLTVDTYRMSSETLTAMHRAIPFLGESRAGGFDYGDS